MRRHLGVAVVVVAVVAVVAAACSDDSDESVSSQAPPLTPSASDQTYPDEVRAIDDEINTKVEEIDEALAATWPTRGRLFSVLDEAALPGTFATMLERASALEAPDGYGADHQLYLDSLSESVDLSGELQEAIEDEDLLRFRLRITDLLLSRARLLLNASASFCQTSLGSDPPPGCASGEPAPGGEYGEALRDIGRRFQSEFSARVGSFPPAMTEDELRVALETLQPAIISALEEAGDEVSDLDPPDELRADHEVVVRYFTDTLEVARAISQAAEDGDQEALAFEFGRSGTVLCEAVQGFSDEAREITNLLNSPDCGQPADPI